ncbi:MAG: hypothetical protein ACUVSQ_08045 [Pseudanabaenaceae cyanobacterium]
MARAFWWRNRQVEIQTDYHEHGVCVSVRIEGQDVGCYDHFEQALAAIRRVVIGNAPISSPVAVSGDPQPLSQAERGETQPMS